MYCFLCRKSFKVVFSFPTDTYLRNLWMKICNLNATFDEVSGLFLCINHFLTQNIITDNGTVMLKQGSFPSINVPNPVKLISLVVQPKPVVTTETESSSLTTLGSSLGDKSVRSYTQNDVNISTIIKNEPNQLDGEEIFIKCEKTEHGDDSGDDEQPSKSTGVEVPRYIGDITPNHLSNPNNAEKIMIISKTTVENLNKKIRKLEKTKRDLEIELYRLEEKVIELSRKRMKKR